MGSGMERMTEQVILWKMENAFELLYGYSVLESRAVTCLPFSSGMVLKYSVSGLTGPLPSEEATFDRVTYHKSHKICRHFKDIHNLSPERLLQLQILLVVVNDIKFACQTFHHRISILLSNS
jgi:hypothetical protein